MDNLFNKDIKAATPSPAPAKQDLVVGNIQFDKPPHFGHELKKHEFHGKHKGENSREFSLETILERIDNIITTDSYLKDAINSIKDMQVPDGYDTQIIIGKIESVIKIVECREDTNRRAIEFLERMFDGLRPEKNEFQIKKMEMIEKIISNNELSDESRNTAFDMLRDI